MFHSLQLSYPIYPSVVNVRVKRKNRCEMQDQTDKDYNVSPTQLDLFSQPTFGTVIRDIKIAMKEAVELSGLSREQVVDAMNELALRHGVRLNNGNAKALTKETLEKWVNPKEESHVPPIKALPIFCAVVKTTAPLNVQARVIGGMLISEDDIKLLRWAKASWKAKRARKEIRKLEEFIDG